MDLLLGPWNLPAKLWENVWRAVCRSGSMGDAANPNGAEEAKLFSKMDLAKRGRHDMAWHGKIGLLKAGPAWRGAERALPGWESPCSTMIEHTRY